MESESQIIKRISDLFGGVNFHSSANVGIGDDCGLIHWDRHEDKMLLMTKDLLIEDVHFSLKTYSPYDIGCKTAQVNLSDIAAKGGKPLYALLAMGLPRQLKVDWILEFLLGLRDSLHGAHVNLLGGDTSSSPQHCYFDLTVVGEIEKSKLKLRSMAKEGDLVVVTGFLGDSCAGLKCLQDHFDLSLSECRHYLETQHKRPMAHLAQVEWLANCIDVHAMMDVSDGPDKDLTKIGELSKCSFDIDLESLPLSLPLKQFGKSLSLTQLSLWEMALTGGEDYCLLFTMDPKNFLQIGDEYRRKFSSDLYPIGRVVKQRLHNERPFYFLDGKQVYFKGKGYEHFSS